MKDRNVKAFLAAILVIVLVFGTAFAITYKDSKEIVPADKIISGEENTKKEPSKNNEEEKQQLITVNFISAGDNLIHDGIYEQANRRAGGGDNYDFSYCYENIASVVAKADVATINQETIIAKSRQLSGYPQFNSPHQVGDEIAKIGFDVVNLANNHMVDQYESGLKEAIEYWDSVEGVTRTGAYKNKEDLNRVEYIESNGLKIGLVGVTRYTNGLYLPDDSELEIIYTSEEDLIEKKIKAAKEECDIVLVNAHWGEEYQTQPDQNQRDLAKKMANWGADVIIGHHPHVLQPVEFIEKEDGTRTLVAYSLGNFISQQNTPMRVLGGMLEYSVTKDTATNKLTIDNVKFLPTVTHYVRGVDDVKIYLLSQYSDELAHKQAARLECSELSVSYFETKLADIVDEKYWK